MFECRTSRNLKCFPAGPQQKPSLHWLWPQHQNREDLRWSPQVHSTHHLWRPGPTGHLAPQQQLSPGQCVLFSHRPVGGLAERQHEREKWVWHIWTDPVPNICWWESLELQLHGQSELTLLNHNKRFVFHTVFIYLFCLIYSSFNFPFLSAVHGAAAPAESETVRLWFWHSGPAHGDHYAKHG